jgi:hypothetical protein|nr:MAG TPA: hypothetical protein [Caudoviricetes sp.]
MYKDFETIRKRMSHIEDKMMFMFSTFEKMEDEKEIFRTVEELAVLMSAIYVDNKIDNIDMIDNVCPDELAISFSHIINYLYPGEDDRTYEFKTLLFAKVLYYIYKNGISYFMDAIKLSYRQKLIVELNMN